MKSLSKVNLLAIILLLIPILAFTAEKDEEETTEETTTEKQSDEEIERERAVNHVEKILKLEYSNFKNNNVFNSSQLDKGILAIKSGDEKFLKTITYEKLLYFIRGLGLKSATRGSTTGITIKVTPLGVLSKGTREAKVIAGIFGGIKNKDPRIRLFTLKTLQSFNPTKEIIGNLIKLSKFETVRNANYHYVDIELNVNFGNLRIEFILLKKILRRKALLATLNNNQVAHPSMFIDIDPYSFKVLADRISNEADNEIPLNTFGENKINYFIAGLLNKNAYVKQRCAEFLYKLYYQKGISIQTQRRIELLKGDAFSFEREARNEGYRNRFLEQKKEYPRLIVEGSSMLKRVFDNMNRERFADEVSRSKEKK